MPKPPQSDAAVAKATGRTWDEWVAWLDARGGRTLDHKGLVAAVTDEVTSGWWRQAVAVGYERLAHDRAVNARPDGFQIQASKTIAASPEAVWAAVCPDGLCAWAPPGALEPSTEKPPATLRGAWRGAGDAAPARFGASLTAAPNGKTRLTVQLSRLPDAEAAEAAKVAWRSALETLKGRLES